MKTIPVNEIISRLEAATKTEIAEFAIQSGNIVQITLKDGFVSTFDSDWIAEHIEENEFQVSVFAENGLVLFETNTEFNIWKNQN